MLLNIYLATTVASIAIDFTQSIAIKRNLLKKGYVFSSEKKKINLVSTIVNLFAPGFNIYMAYKLLIADEKGFEENLLKSGTIYKPQEKVVSTHTEKPIAKREETQTLTTKPKTYEEMSIEEKREFLQRQRERILSDLSATDEEINTLGRQR